MKKLKDTLNLRNYLAAVILHELEIAQTHFFILDQLVNPGELRFYCVYQPSHRAANRCVGVFAPAFSYVRVETAAAANVEDVAFGAGRAHEDFLQLKRMRVGYVA
jgi:hypothetical protein